MPTAYTKFIKNFIRNKNKAKMKFTEMVPPSPKFHRGTMWEIFQGPMESGRKRKEKNYNDKRKNTRKVRSIKKI